MTLGRFSIARCPLPTLGRLRGSGDAFQFQSGLSQLLISEYGCFLLGQSWPVGPSPLLPDFVSLA